MVAETAHSPVKCWQHGNNVIYLLQKTTKSKPQMKCEHAGSLPADM